MKLTNTKQKRIRIVHRSAVLVGDCCGKTSLCAAVPWAKTQQHTVFEHKILNINLTVDQHVELRVYDTSHSLEYDIVRPMIYYEAQVILLCFAVDNLPSFQNIETK
ncbi:hypothetical protein HK100_006130, partial [Physocladia obscura]